MSFRFQRRIKILPGIRLNLSKSGISTSIGVPGARITLGSKGTRTTVGLPGSGISYTQIDSTRTTQSSSATGILLLVLGLLVLALFFG